MEHNERVESLAKMMQSRCWGGDVWENATPEWQAELLDYALSALVWFDKNNPLSAECERLEQENKYLRSIMREPEEL